jgi:hypothetical protein
MIPWRGRRSRKERTRRQHPLHISARIRTTTSTIVISIVTLNISIGSYIHNDIQRTVRRMLRRRT